MTLGFKIKSKSKKVYARARARNRNKFSRRGKKMVSKCVLKKGRSRRRVTRKGGFMRGGGSKLKRPGDSSATTTTATAKKTLNLKEAAIKEAREQAAREQEALKQAVIQENIKMLEEETQIKALTNLANNQHREIQSSSCVNGPDYFELPGYCEFLAYIESLEEKEEKEEKTIEEAKTIVEEVNKRRGLLRGENGYNVFKNLGPEILINKLIKMVIVNVGGSYMILWSYANMLNYNYAEDYFKKWVTKNDDGTFTIRSVPKEVVLITREIIRDIESVPAFNHQLVSGNLLLTRSYYPNRYNDIINTYFTEYDMANTVFICPIYEIPHSAIANNFNGRQLQMSEEFIPRPLIYAGLEGVFYMKNKKKDATRYFVIANLSGHYKTPKDRMPFVAWVLNTYYGYREITDIPDPPPPSPPSYIDSDSSDSSDAGPREEWRRFITNDPAITTFEQALQKLDSADSTPVDDSSTHTALISQGSQGTGSIGSQPN